MTRESFQFQLHTKCVVKALHVISFANWYWNEENKRKTWPLNKHTQMRHNSRTTTTNKLYTYRQTNISLFFDFLFHAALFFYCLNKEIHSSISSCRTNETMLKEVSIQGTIMKSRNRVQHVFATRCVFHIIFSSLPIFSQLACFRRWWWCNKHSTAITTTNHTFFYNRFHSTGCVFFCHGVEQITWELNQFFLSIMKQVRIYFLIGI